MYVTYSRALIDGTSQVRLHQHHSVHRQAHSCQWYLYAHRFCGSKAVVRRCQCGGVMYVTPVMFRVHSTVRTVGCVYGSNMQGEVSILYNIL